MQHHRAREAEVAGTPFRWTPGCRGYPRPPAGWALLVEAARELRGEVLDASACLGVPGRSAVSARVTVLEPSAAGLAAARLDLATPGPDAAGCCVGSGNLGSVSGLAAGLPWDAPVGAFDHVLLAPPAERGSARVRGELAAAARALGAGGDLWLLLEKDRGAKRYEGDAAAAVGRLEVVARTKGWRLARVRRGAGDLPAPARPAPRAPWIDFETSLGPARSLAGTFAAGKLDPGTAVLVAALDDRAGRPDGRRVLDLGCGWGALSRWAARGGGQVTAVDDDLAAVTSTRCNVPEAHVLHSDLDAALPPGERFDQVLVNPPFHLGAGVRLELPAAFVAVAARRVSPGGEVWLVANADLPYEDGLTEAVGAVREVRREAGFKVLRARPRTSR